MTNNTHLLRAPLSLAATFMSATALTFIPSASAAEWAAGFNAIEEAGDAESYVLEISGDGNWAAGTISISEYDDANSERGIVFNSNFDYFIDRYDYGFDRTSEVVGLSDDGSYAFLESYGNDSYAFIRVGLEYDEFSGVLWNNDDIKVIEEADYLGDFTASGEFAVGSYETTSATHITQLVTGDRTIDSAFYWDAVNGFVNLADTNGDTVIKDDDEYSIAGTDIESNSWNWSGGSEALAITPDGSVVVGYGNGVGRSGNVSADRAFVWNNSDRIMVPFIDVYNHLRGNESTYSSANDVSDDGKVIVGQNGGMAFTWIDHPDYAGGLLFDLSDTNEAWVTETTQVFDNAVLTYTSSADFVSSNGAIVIGSRVSNERQDIFVWDQSNDNNNLDIISENAGWGIYSFAEDITPDGSVIVGATTSCYDVGSCDEASLRAFRWDAQNNELVLLAEGSGWAEDLMSIAKSVSNDGSVVGGVYFDPGLAVPRAFIYRTPTLDAENPPTLDAENPPMLDAKNTVSAIVNNVVAQGTSIAAIGASLSLAAETELDASEVAKPSNDTISSKSYSDRLPTVIRLGASASSNADTGSLSFGSASGAIGLSEEMTIGGFAALGTKPSSLGGLAFDGAISSFGAFVRRNPLGGSGLTWKAALATSVGDVTISRDDSLVGTEAASGSSGLSSTSASFELGYRILAQNRVTSPFLRLARTSTTRAAYDEGTSYSFPISYDAVTELVKTATLGVDSRLAINESNTLRLTAGLEKDLSRSNSPITGTSDIPNLTSISIDVADIAVIQNHTRGYVGLGLSHDIGNDAAITFDLRADQNAFTATPTYSGGIFYQMKF